MRCLLWISIGLSGAVTFADLPKTFDVPKDEIHKLVTAGLNYTDNQTPEASEGLRKALLKAQNKGVLKQIGDPYKLSDVQLKNLGKNLKLVENCEVVAFDANNRISRTEIWTGTPTEQQLANFKAWCKASAVKVFPALIPAPSLVPSAAGQ